VSPKSEAPFSQILGLAKKLPTQTNTLAYFDEKKFYDTET